jgi:hypothetical protein
MARCHSHAATSGGVSRNKASAPDRASREENTADRPDSTHTAMPSAPAEPKTRMFRRARNAHVTTAISRNANIATRSAPLKCSTVPKNRHIPFIATAVATPAATTVRTSSACWPRSAVRTAAATRHAARHSMNTAASAAAATTAAAAR